jgi:hypothetical protein
MPDTSTSAQMRAEDFANRIARVRDRFADALPGRIADGFAALERMSSGGGDGIESGVATHRMLHEIYGIAPTLGFLATGTAAGHARTVIREAAKTRRIATSEEISALHSALESLRSAAESDLDKLVRRTP